MSRRLHPDVVRAHDDAVAKGLDFYIDPHNKLLVMTRLHHESRGSCCHNGCRHCPYEDFEK
jgi:hypothetical protein